MAQRYSYTIEGTGRDNQRWETAGAVVSSRSGSFMEAVQEALRVTFMQLTDSKARYGDLKTCQGPYTISKMVIELETGKN